VFSCAFEDPNQESEVNNPRLAGDPLSPRLPQTEVEMRGGGGTAVISSQDTGLDYEFLDRGRV
jgi:hypothetical protein